MSVAARDASTATHWHVTDAVLPRLFAGVALLIGGLLAGRFDVAALAVPIVLSLVWGLARRPATDGEVRLDRARYDDRGVAATLRIRPPEANATARLRVSVPTHRDREVLIDAAAPRALTLSFPTVRTGRQEAFRVDHQLWGDRGISRTKPRALGPQVVIVLPKPALLGELPLPDTLQGLTGSHRSVRPGEGGEFRDLAPFRTGNRLRHIDWKATARRAGGTGPAGVGSELYVRRTFATSDAHVMLVLDARDAVGPDVAGWDFGSGSVLPTEPTSLDLGRRAATSLARRYLEQGDRVGLVELGGRRRPLRPAGGRRHLNTLVHHLALAEPEGDPAKVVAAPRLPSGVLAVVLSSYLDDVAADLAIDWRYHGHRVVAVDTLPKPRLDHLESQARVAFRLLAMERENRLARLRTAGVEIVRWNQAPGEVRVEAALAVLARPRRVRR